eukprot:Awhi_evm1s7127
MEVNNSFPSQNSSNNLELCSEDWVNIFEEKDDSFKKQSNVSETGRRNWGGCCRGFIMFLVPPIVLASLVAVKLGLVALADVANDEITVITRKNKASEDNVTLETLAVAYAWLLLGIVAPTVLNTGYALVTSGARELKYPTKGAVFMSLFLGMLEGIGYGILGAAVLLRLSLLSGISIMLAIVPASCLGELFQKTLVSKSRRFFLIFSLLIVVGCFGALVYFTNDYHLAWMMGVSLFLVGIPWWTRNAPLNLQKLKFYYYCGFLNNLIQIPAIALTVWVIWILDGYDALSLWTLGFPGLMNYETSYIAGLMVIGGAFLGYHFGWLACSLCFQKIGFAAPLALSSLVAYGVIVGICLGTDKNCVEISDLYTYEVPVFLALFIIQVVITRHVWYENVFPIPLSKALWNRVGYSAVGIEQFLLLNRREKALRFKIKRNPSEESLPSVLTNGSLATFGSSSKFDDVKTINSCTSKDETNYVFMCTTMWHENTKEMHHLLASFLRIDSGRTETAEKTVYEGHLLFDDAVTPAGAYNEYVNLFLSLLPKEIPSIKEYITPYGYQLLITLPNGLQVYVHLKDKTKIRNKKRWSQIMYMFYILRFRVITCGLDINHVFILTTDGDTEFDLPSTRDLLLYLKRNHIVGGVCSRVFPKGGGPVAWFQVFEYAVGHWLQKAAENVLGSVLCLPGCFSMLRGTALEEVMHIYTTNAVSGKEFLQYDQGEDRWLSTLLLKHGWLLQYAASADAYTYCPSTFHEFFNQRRRWVSSTIANIFDLIMNSGAVVHRNISISRFYMAYQALLLIGTIISPGIILMMMGAGLNAGFGINQSWISITFLILTILYALICLRTTSNTQIKIAWVLSLLGGIVMIFVMVGFIVTVADDPTTLSSSFVLFLVGTMVIAALLHPREAWCLICGIVYLFALPSVFIFLMVYSVANIDNVSWGTRESKIKENNKADSKLANARRILAKLKFWKKNEAKNNGKDLLNSTESKDILVVNTSDDSLLGNDDDYNKEFPDKDVNNASHLSVRSLYNIPPQRLAFARSSTAPLYDNVSLKSHDSAESYRSNGNDDYDYEVSQSQLDREEIERALFLPETVHEFKLLEKSEYTFWELLIAKYLEVEKPTPTNLAKKAQILEMLKELRDSSLFSLILINTIILLVFIAVYGQESLIILDSSAVTLLLSIFALLVLVQFLSMLWHRLAMVCHVVATANKYDQDAKRKKSQEKRIKKAGEKVAKKEEKFLQAKRAEEAHSFAQ